MSEHVCDTGNFDRTLCPEPCGYMHSYCDTCGKRQDPCAHDEPTPTVREAGDEGIADRMDAVSDLAMKVAEDVWTEDEPTLAEYELTDRILAALLPLIAEREAKAEQRGREDNADHGMCYVSGSKALEARERAAGADRAARDQRRYDHIAKTLHTAVLRAEAAEAKVARVEALAGEWDATADRCDHRHGSCCSTCVGRRIHARDVRAALAPETPKGDA